MQTRRSPRLQPWGAVTPTYFARLDQIGAAQVQAAFDRISAEHDGRDLVLLCYEDLDKVYPDGEREWCHRLVFAEWWLVRTGGIILELPRAGAPADPTGTHAASLWTWEDAGQPSTAASEE